MTENLARTPLYDWHAAHGGRMVDFAGWSMPVQYASIADEHAAVRSAVGLFDVSHMGRLRFDGTAPSGVDVSNFLDGLLTRRVGDMKPGQVRYSLITDERGGILDDVLLYRLQDAAGGSYHLLVVNASNREKIVEWLRPYLEDSPGIRMTDVTTSWAMLAVQGPKSRQLVQPLIEAPLDKMRYYQGTETRIAGHGGVVSRTGYTGEDGWELIVGSAAAQQIWEQLLAAGADVGAKACGLGARDTLRLEAGMPLYGHELSEDVTPFQAGLNFAVNLENRDFPGRAALLPLQNDTRMPRRVGLDFDGKRVPREGYAVVLDGRPIGRVTSGTFSPTFNRPIAMAYVEPEFAQIGQELAVDVRGKAEPCRVVPLPFYRREQ
jgi:aminomethyltransferase